MVRTTFVLALAACGEPAATGPVLPSDAYYTQTCDLPGCKEQLGFCSDGTWSMLVSDGAEFLSGTYVLDDGLAIDNDVADEDPSFTFDFTTQRVLDGLSDAFAWQATTAVQDPDVACAQ